MKRSFKCQLWCKSNIHRLAFCCMSLIQVSWHMLEEWFISASMHKLPCTCLVQKQAVKNGVESIWRIGGAVLVVVWTRNKRWRQPRKPKRQDYVKQTYSERVTQRPILTHSVNAIDFQPLNQLLACLLSSTHQSPAFFPPIMSVHRWNSERRVEILPLGMLVKGISFPVV